MATELPPELAMETPLSWAVFANRGLWKAYPYLCDLAESLYQLCSDDYEMDRLMVVMPPRHGKSTLCSLAFPTWYIKKWPDRHVMVTGYGGDFAADWGRDIRNQVEEYSWMDGVRASPDRRAAHSWRIDGRRGRVHTAGVGGPITGRGAHIFICDDPIKGEEVAANVNQREKLWRWWLKDARPRLEPGGKVLLIQCMTGDTPVLMATGDEKPLCDIRPGDEVATYEHGRVSVSTVRNWTNQGPDQVYKIRMKSGIIVKANARHPFLVEEDGETKWQRTVTLKKGSVILKVIGASGEASLVPKMGATSQPIARACAARTTASIAGKLAFDRLRSILGRGVMRTCAIATELVLKTINAFWTSREEFAPSASSLLQKTTPAPIGLASFASIIATTAKRLGASFATTAILQSDTARPKKSYSQPLSMCEIGRDTVVEVVENGIEDVFDVEIERTENFIANGLVSHNTRWHEDDFAGRFLKEMEVGGEQWTIHHMPALSDEHGKPLQCTDENWGKGTPLCPDRYSAAALWRIRKEQGPYDFNCLYQGTPTHAPGQFWDPHLFNESVWVDAIPQTQTRYCVIANDPSLGKDQKRADYNAVVSLCTTDADLIYIDCEMERCGAYGSIEMMSRLIDRLPQKPHVIAVESVAFQEVLCDILRPALQRNRIFCPVVPWDNENVNKDVRIQSLDALVCNRKLRFVRSRGNRLLIQQFRNYGDKQEHDDGPDAVEMGMQVLADLMEECLIHHAA